MSDSYNGFEIHTLDDGRRFHVGRLPAELIPGPARFENLWDIHPVERPMIHLHGRPVRIPRWQQAYGADYHFSGQTSSALPVPSILDPFLAWAKFVIDRRLNGLLLNWYDGRLGHYIGPHRDSTKNMIPGAPIVTISLGEARTFRLTRGDAGPKSVRDFVADSGSVFVLPFDTNNAWKHGVPKRARQLGRRISITVRAFDPPI